ncbi:DUF4328 domain-containing protein [Luteolibacter arcticus]|uniref:DUF4328 domain-containing protein n=1 Tax=Luteolibacter arcticus TaxID=1581411 RepID=A0ABT3GFF0_9BACT|nr:DUF4328 domain-containing protein [Luteolibacter arcticus]MCW1922040.1 DUF4328 domain-containing protein [Luteolibacter arcticus]
MENPYQPPASADESPVPPVAGLKNPRPLALVAVWLYGISLGAEVADHLWRSLAALPPALFPDGVPSASATNEGFGTVEYHSHDTYYVDAGFGPLDWLMTVPGLASYVVYLVWKYRAATNARILDPWAMTISPAMAVGSYFIPFVFFVVPYRAMVQIARATLGNALGVGLWWACHIGLLLFVIAIAIQAVMESPRERPSLLEHLYVVGAVITFMISTWLVMKITRAQAAQCVG